MTTPAKVIARIEATSSRNEKEAIIAAALKAGCKEFFEGAKLAYDALVTFGVKKVPERSGKDGNGLSFRTFQTLANSLIDRQVTGHAARDAIEAAMNAATNEEWNGWYRRILIKDLRCGASEKTINTVLKGTGWKDLEIPVFTCQLAQDGTDQPKKLVGEKIIEVKLDGARVLTVVYPNGKVDQYSRSGKELSNFEAIKAQFAKVAHALVEPWVYDGEVMSSSFQDLMKQIHRKDGTKANDAVLHVFDCMPLSEFEKGGWKATQTFRSEHLKVFVEHHQKVLTHVEMVGQELVNLSTPAGQKRFKEINASAIAGGYEGIMLKDPKAPYLLKRADHWLKIKPTISVDLTVVDLEEGTGKHEGRLGALVCEGVDGGRKIRVNVGSGFSDEQREQFWKGSKQVKGQLVEVEADVITQNQDGSYSLRFPRFMRFRSMGGAKV